MLTFVVPTIPGRESLLSRCLWSLTNQAHQATILVIEGDARLGDKANAAAQQVDTMYMTVVDDDDYVAADYLEAVMPRLGLVDYCGFRFLELENGRYYNECKSMGDYPAWGRRSRGPVPKGVTKTEIWRRVRFGNHYHADREWSEAVTALVHMHAFVDRALYVHDWWPESSAFGDGWQGAAVAPRDIGMWPHPAVERMTVNERKASA